MKASIAMLLAAMFMIAGCNTVKGAGQDIEAGGEKVQRSAEDVQKKM
jgi:entericidin B